MGLLGARTNDDRWLAVGDTLLVEALESDAEKDEYDAEKLDPLGSAGVAVRGRLWRPLLFVPIVDDTEGLGVIRMSTER